MVSLPGTNRNWLARAGDLWQSSIVMAAVGWVGANIHQAPICAFRSEGGKPVRYSRGSARQVERLLARPNPYYSYQTLMASTMLSLIVSGNAYWYIIRDGAGMPKELWYIPHIQIEPAWESGATTDNWISHYTYRENGQEHSLPYEDVIHFREGALDPRNPRKGLSRLHSALRQIATDNEIATYEATILANTGVPGLIITPKDGTTEFSDPEKIRDVAYDRIAGDERGKPLVFEIPADVTAVGFSPEQLLLGEAGESGEARVCALIGINPVVLGLKSGLGSSSYNNAREFEAQAWQNGIVPRLLTICGELDVQLLPLYEVPENVSLLPDLSGVVALATDQKALYERLTKAVGGPFMMPEEAREAAGLPMATPEQLARLEELRSKSKATPTTEQPDPNEGEDENNG
jgi:HK97 family phage portal protein